MTLCEITTKMQKTKKLLIFLAVVTIAIIIVQAGTLMWAIIESNGISNLESNTNINSIDQSATTALLKISDQTLVLEKAETPQAQEKGLMNRTELNKTSGMIFIFDSEEPRTFWMKNTLISLDIIYLDKDFKIVTIYSNTKTNQVSEIYPSVFPSKYVIELNAGSAEFYQFKIGDTLLIKL